MTRTAQKGLVFGALIVLGSIVALWTVTDRPPREEACAGSEPVLESDRSGTAEPEVETPSERSMAVAPFAGSAEGELSEEDLLRLPEGFRKELEAGSLHGLPVAPGAKPGSTEVQKRKSLGPDWLDLSVESERIEGPNPSVGVQSTDVKAGVKVSPRKTGDSPGDVSISVEGGVRQEVSEREPELPQRSPSVGVKVEVPWPLQQGPEPAKKKTKD